ncbi:hypothetical protein DPEC_G00326910 [Dallia pectoralis]|uniref:Uncharacterized protein n=1 Tax=Dallia pectoralis TaxID=75939 RepID=A0ACC2F802_DALPE|nr:hypothetical protein DPEC_G00326910 [Dallia pectoralis]
MSRRLYGDPGRAWLWQLPERSVPAARTRFLLTAPRQSVSLLVALTQVPAKTYALEKRVPTLANGAKRVRWRPTGHEESAERRSRSRTSLPPTRGRLAPLRLPVLPFLTGPHQKSPSPEDAISLCCAADGGLDLRDS